MTKEKIFKKHHTFAEWDLIPNEESCLSAMEEYAKQESIEFNKWIISNTHYKFSEHKKSYVDANNKSIITPEQLYELYLKDKNK